MIIGYARTSTIDQTAGFESQLRELEGVKCQKIFREQTSSVGIRLQLETALEFIRQDDVLVVTKLDRLARSVADLMRIIQALERRALPCGF
jgi:DNA invertase Pin-like site-specific DNA recombinase